MTIPSSSSQVSASALPDIATANAAVADKAAEKDYTKSIAKAVATARAERKKGRPAKAMAVLDGAARKNANNKALAKERGLLALELGQLGKAEKLLKSAMEDDTKDWRLYSALGSTHAAKGNQQEAQAQFAKALELAPDHPSVMNNLALSFALEGRHKEAEELLRKAAVGKNAKLQTKQNLALLLGMDGKISEARRVSRASLPESQAEVNISFLESLKRSAAKVSRATPAPKSEAIRAANSQTDSAQ
ncbi:MAG: tetratricopeptide repeat protein [Hyphomicrobiaceae bacterium]